MTIQVFWTVLVLLYAAALAALLWVAKRNRRLYAAAKGMCSLLFLVAAGAGAAFGRPGTNSAAMLAALALCAAGDVLLGLANLNAERVSKKPFMGGVGCFTLAHCAFCLFFMLQGGFSWYALPFPVLLLAILRLLEHKDAVRLKKIRPVGYLYTFLVGLMASMALARPFAFPGGALMGAGAALFFLSDVVLLFLYFGTRRRPWYRPTNLLCYYFGIFLMAAAVQYL